MKKLIVEIEPKPKTILELFEGHPERWHQGCSFRNAKGDQVQNHGAAASMCLGAAIGFVYDGTGLSHEKLLKLLEALLDKGYERIPHWQDATHRKFDDVLELVREAGV